MGPAAGAGASSDFFNFDGDNEEVEIPELALLKLTVSLPLEESFFFRKLLAALVGVLAVEAAGEPSLEREGDKDLGFFLSDRIGELELDPNDRGLLEDPSGLEVSDFFEEKNLPLNTISVSCDSQPPLEISFTGQRWEYSEAMGVNQHKAWNGDIDSDELCFL